MSGAISRKDRELTKPQKTKKSKTKKPHDRAPPLTAVLQALGPCTVMGVAVPLGIAVRLTRPTRSRYFSAYSMQFLFPAYGDLLASFS